MCEVLQLHGINGNTLFNLRAGMPPSQIVQFEKPDSKIGWGAETWEGNEYPALGKVRLFTTANNIINVPTKQ
jgi:hypothetical protein